MKVYAIYSEGMNVFVDQRTFKTKRAARNNLESFFACTIGHDAEIKELEKPSYDDLTQRILQLESALIDMSESLEFYAAEKNWRDIVAEEAINDKHGLSEGCFDSIIYEDCENDIGGKRAREVLLRNKEILDTIYKRGEE